VVVGVTSITWAFSKGIYTVTDLEGVEDALNVGQLRFEEIFSELKDMDLTMLTTANAQDFESRKGGTVSGYDITVDLHEGDLDLTASENLMQVDLTVTWDVKGGQANVILTSLVADY